jgi:transposase
MIVIRSDAPVEENQHALKESQIARTALIEERTRLPNRQKTQPRTITKRHTRTRIQADQTPTRRV